MTWTTIGLALMQPSDAAGQAPLIEGAKLESIWDYVTKGGPTMAAIGLCSLLAVAVIAERLMLLRKRRVAPPALLESLRGAGGDSKRALEICSADGSPAANIIAAAIRRRGEPRDAVEAAIRDTGSREMVRLRHRMRLLSALPQVATMLGLLGTIFGMIKTFQAVAISGEALGKTEMLAKGIFEAWTCTAAGLLVAIPVLVAYHILMGRIDQLAVELDRAASEWLEGEAERTRVGASPAAPERPARTQVSAEPATVGAPAMA